MKWLNAVFGEKKMSALPAGTTAPNFELPAMIGQELDGSSFSLSAALARGPVLAIFFKVSCPVCQYAFPYFERIYKTYGGKQLTIVGISQNDSKDTASFLKKFGVTFPVLLDEPKTYPASNAYGLTNVPTTFWITEDGTIEISSVGWMRQEFEEMAAKAAAAIASVSIPIFQPQESISDFRPG
jgi:peroxiredoxin